MCGRKFVWRQGTKYVVGLQKYWVTSKTVGSQHFPEALHVFQPSGLGSLPNQKGALSRGFPHREKLFRIYLKDPLNSRFVSYYRSSRRTRSRTICRETADSADKRKM